MPYKNIEERRAKIREYYQKNKKTIIKNQKKRIENNREKYEEYHRNYRQKHREELRQKSQKFRKQNPEKVRDWNKRYYYANKEQRAIDCKKWCEANREWLEHYRLNKLYPYRKILNEKSECERCGTTKNDNKFRGQGKLVVHHKDKDRKNQERNNLVVLCWSCHTLIHNYERNKTESNECKKWFKYSNQDNQ